MTHRTEKLFIETDIDVTLNITSGFTVGDISELEVELIHPSDNTVAKSYRYSTGGITIDEGVIMLLIGKEDITAPGYYRFVIRLTDMSGKLRGINSNPKGLTFYNP